MMQKGRERQQDGKSGVNGRTAAMKVEKTTQTGEQKQGLQHTCQTSQQQQDECIEAEPDTKHRKKSSRVSFSPCSTTNCLACQAAWLTASSTPLTPTNDRSSSPSVPRLGTRILPNGEIEYDFAGSLDVIRQVCHFEGWWKLYSGLNSALIGVGMSSGVYFFLYHLFKNFVLRQTGRSTMGPLANLGVASVAGALNVMATLPIWVVNTRMTLAKQGEYRSVMDAVRKIYEEEGWRGFWRGIVPSLILVSNPAIQFVVYEQLIRLLTRRQAHAAATASPSSTSSSSTAASSIQLSSFQYFILGAIAKAVATVATYPYQVVKSRQQASRTKQQVTTWQTIVEMWREEGVASFFNGMNAKMSQTVLNAAVSFATYERLLQTFIFLTTLMARYSQGKTGAIMPPAAKPSLT